MDIREFSDQFDIYYQNVTSNQAPGLNEYEKSVFLTRAEKEEVLNYFSANSKGNNLQQGFDDSAKRQADFSTLMKTAPCTLQGSFTGGKIDDRSSVYSYPSDVFIVVNETIKTTSTPPRYLQVIPLRYDEYTRLMSKPFKRPVKNHAWRLMNSGTNATGNESTKYVEIITNVGDTVATNGYSVRYVRTPRPIILGDLDGQSIDGYKFTGQTYPADATAIDGECEVDPILHEAILQRAVELAKISWTATGQDNMNPVIQAGQRSE